jgi:serine/threonine-protein kinase SRPK3
MNGAQQTTKDALAQKPPQGAGSAAPANGNSAINKKRKKDGLKPIITNEGPGYVHRNNLPYYKDCSMALIFFPLPRF